MKRKLVKFVCITAATLALAACGKSNAVEESQVGGSVVESSVKESSEENSSEAESIVASSETESQEQEKEPAVDYMEAYAPVLDKYYNLIFGPEDAFMDEDDINGLYEMCMYNSPDEVVEWVGYRIEDLTGDGIPELLIGIIDNANEGTDLLAIYSYKDGKPVFVNGGWSRYTVAWLGDNRFFEYGSGGAIYSIFGTFELSEDGTEMNYTDYYFSHEYNDDYEDVRFYHNTTGEWDVEKSELVEEDMDTTWARYDAWDEASITMRFESMAVYEEKTGKVRPETDEKEPEGIYAYWAKDVKSDYSDYEMVNLDAGDLAEEVAIFSAVPMSDFRVLNLTFKDVDEDGKLIFDTEEAYYIEEVLMPVVIKMCFTGDIPNVGISFVQDGVTKYYGITISGMDGSLQLIEF